MINYTNSNINKETLCCCIPTKIDSELCESCGHSADECCCDDKEMAQFAQKVKKIKAEKLKKFFK